MNLLDSDILETIITLIKPDRIVHLASISNTEQCEANPVRTLDTNGRVVAVLCDCIVRNKLACKLFHASSSEIYKGHQDYVITDNDDSMLPTSMYAIGKTMAHTIVDKYRQKYNVPFSNGILFTTESKYRSSEFLFMKIAQHAKDYTQTKSPISVGNLDSWRNINHAADIANAIRIILDQIHGDTYVICSSEFHKVENIVIDIYKKHSILLESKEGCLVEKTSGNIVVHIGQSLRNTITKINGDAKKLRALGWKPYHTLDTILAEL